MKTVPIEKLLAEIKGFSNAENISDAQLKEFILRALELLEIPELMHAYLTVKEVRNYTADLPEGLLHLLDIGKLGKFIEKKDLLSCYKTVPDLSETPDPVTLCEDTEVVKHCPLDRYYFPLELINYTKFYSETGYTPMYYKPVKMSGELTNRSMVVNNMLLYRDKAPVYFTIYNDVIKTSFESGQIAVSYLGYHLGKEGSIRIPDDARILEAIKAFVFMKIAEKAAWMRDPKLIQIASFWSNKFNTLRREAIAHNRLKKYSREGSMKALIERYMTLLPLRNYK